MHRRNGIVWVVGGGVFLIACSVLAQQPAGAGAGAGAGGGGGRGGGGRGGGAGAGGAAAGGAPAGGAARGNTARIPLFFKEEWKQDATSSEHPLSQESVMNPNLELKLYGQNHDVLITG